MWQTQISPDCSSPRMRSRVGLRQGFQHLIRSLQPFVHMRLDKYSRSDGRYITYAKAYPMEATWTQQT